MLRKDVETAAVMLYNAATVSEFRPRNQRRSKNRERNTQTFHQERSGRSPQLAAGTRRAHRQNRATVKAAGRNPGYWPVASKLEDVRKGPNDYCSLGFWRRWDFQVKPAQESYLGPHKRGGTAATSRDISVRL
jgi:hypothetical protein